MPNMPNPKLLKAKVLQILESLPEGASWLTLLELCIAESDREASEQGALTERPPEPGACVH
jgi:hypothetical protein